MKIYDLMKRIRKSFFAPQRFGEERDSILCTLMTTFMALSTGIRFREMVQSFDEVFTDGLIQTKIQQVFLCVYNSDQTQREAIMVIRMTTRGTPQFARGVRDGAIAAN